MQSTGILSLARDFELTRFSEDTSKGSARKPVEEKQICLKARVQFKNPYIEVSYYLENLHGSSFDLLSENSSRFSETLWQKTCFEFFLRFPEQNLYWEWNWNLNSKWGAFCFDGERIRNSKDKLLEAGASKIIVESPQKNIFKIQTSIHTGFSNKLGWLMSQSEMLKKTQISLNAILLSSSNEMSYWALKHSPVKANFHKFENFIEWQPL